MQKIRKILNHKSFLVIFLIFSALIFLFRANLDKDHIFVASDGQIKFFQSIQISRNKNLSVDCFYPGGELDPSFSYYPIRYPWTIIDSKKNSCVFEYPPFFPAIASLFNWDQNYKKLMYVPLLFYVLSFIFFYLSVSNFSKYSFLNSLLSLLFFYSFPLLTSMDFSESPLYHFCIVIAIFYISSKNQASKLQIFIFGLLMGMAIFFRIEILIPAFFISLSLFLFKSTFRERILSSFSFGVGFLLIISVFFLYNYFISGHILGYRYISSLLENRVVSPSLLFKLQLLKAYLLGDTLMVGIFKFYPLLIALIPVSVYLILKEKLSKIEFIFISSGFLSLLLIPISVNFYGGVGFFGLRYLETPFLFILFGYSLLITRNYQNLNKYLQTIIVFVVLGSIYWSHLSTKEGLKVLRNSAKEFAHLQGIITQKENIVIHTSLYTSIFVGPSLLKNPHFHIPVEGEINKFLTNIQNQKQNIVLLFPPENMYISSDIPESLINNYKTNVDPKNLNLKIISSTVQNGVKIVEAKLIEK